MIRVEERTLRVLEFNKILQLLSEGAVCSSTIDRCLNLKPSEDIYEAGMLLEQTTEAESLLLKKGAPPISPLKNAAGAAMRAEAGGVLSMGDLLSVAHTLRIARELIGYLREDDFEEKYPRLALASAGLCEDKKLEQSIMGSILSEEEMADEASAELYKIRKQIRSLNNKVRDVLNDMIKSPKYNAVLQDAIVTMRGDRFVIPVKSEHKSAVPGIIHDSSASGATIFVEPMAAVEINNKLRTLLSDEQEEIERILMEFSARVGESADIIKRDFRIIEELDFIFAKGKLSRRMGGSAPKLNSDGIINIKKGRHPLIDKSKVVPTDIYLGKDFDTLVVTGPNTGGKTVSLKTLGLLTLMAQAGLHIPADGESDIAVFENVFADIGDEQSIEQSLSTFSAHIVNIIDILKKADYKSLALFDELGAGTDPTEGAALAVAILERTKELGAKTAATTHYSEIKLYALSADRVENAACEFDVESLKPTYKLLIGVPGKSNAFAISKRLGMDEDIIRRAKELVSKDSTRFEDVISSLEDSRRRAERELEGAQAAKAETMAARETALRQQETVEKQKEKILNDARRDAKRIYEQAKKESDRIIREMQELLKSSREDSRKAMEEGRRRLRSGMGKLEEALSEDVFTAKGSAIDPKKLRIGMEVEVSTMNQNGTVLTLPDKNGNLQIQMGILKVTANVTALREAAAKKQKGAEVNVGGGGFNTAAVKSEIDLRGMLADEAVMAADKYLDEAAMAHLESVSIIHGKGTGALRSAIHDLLRHHPHVRSYRLGRYGEGETGVTIVEIK